MVTSPCGLRFSANLIAMLFQALSAKIGIATGRNLAELCRERSRRRSFTLCGGERKRGDGD